MRAIVALERFLEALFERTPARILRARVRPGHLELALDRALDEAVASDPGPVAGAWELRIAPADLAGILAGAPTAAPLPPDAAVPTAAPVPPAGDRADALAASLARHLHATIRARGRRVEGSPLVRLVVDPALERGRVAAGPRIPDATIALPLPVPPPPTARLRVRDAGGGSWSAVVGEHPVALGRAPENGIVLRDPRVSRSHGRLRLRRGTLVYEDLESRNGSLVNGVRVTEAALAPGDRLEIGGSVVVVDAVGER